VFLSEPQPTAPCLTHHWQERGSAWVARQQIWTSGWSLGRLDNLVWRIMKLEKDRSRFWAEWKGSHIFKNALGGVMHASSN
jgi:hypothetical protein